jgi:methionyl-tRNA formyltransferase
MALRIVFCGTPAFALPSLRHLLDRPDFDVVGVVTQPDRGRDRGQQTARSPVKEAALEARVDLFQPERIGSNEALEYFLKIAPDAVVIIAYGQIIPPRLIDLPRLGWINLHASLLPNYRGAAPIQCAIARGERQTGVTTMCIDAGLDTGPLLLRQATSIDPDETAPQLSARLAADGAPLLAASLLALDRGEIQPAPQDSSQASFAPALTKEDGRIDWTRSPQWIYNRIRGLQPWPGAFTLFRGKTCRIWGRPLPAAQSEGVGGERGMQGAPGKGLPPGTIELVASSVVVCCGQGRLLLEGAQREGAKRVTAREFVNGARLVPGERFGA